MGYGAGVKAATIKFFNTYGADMVAALTDTGLFFSAVMAQKAMESGWAKSELASKYNNFGGIKNYGKLPNAGKVMMDTAEVVNGKRVIMNEPFATYATPKISFQEYVKILQDPTKKYTSMGVFTAETPEQQILLMAKAGYTTTPPEQYLKSMQSIIDCFLDLYKLGRISTSVKEPTVVNPATGAAAKASGTALPDWMKTVNSSLGINYGK